MKFENYFFSKSYFISKQVAELRRLEHLMLRNNRLRSLPSSALLSIPTLSLLWLEGNPLPEGVAVNVGCLQNQQNHKGDRDAVVELLNLYDAMGEKDKVTTKDNVKIDESNAGKF